MASFIIAHAITSGHEKGYVKNLNDGAGETYMGITRNNYPTWAGWKIIDQYKKKMGSIKTGTTFSNPQLNKLVQDFYKKNFWDALIKGDNIFSQQQANFIYDFAVNAQYNAVKNTQQALKKFKPNLQTSKSTITPDAMNVMNSDPEKTYKEIFKQREAYYRQLAKQPKYKPFLKNWIDRMYSFPSYIVWKPEGTALNTAALMAQSAWSAFLTMQ